MKKCIVLLAGVLSMQLAHADMCADLRAIHTQSAAHFDGWKRESGEADFGSSFMLDRAASCSIAKNSGSYSCAWTFSNPAELAKAYGQLVEDIKACPPLKKDLPAIISDQPTERSQGGLRQTMEVTGFDYPDVEVVIMIGQMQIVGANAKLSRNELKLSFIKAAGSPGK